LDDSRALAAEEFLDGLATPKSATLAELLEWRNSTGASFLLAADGTVTVANVTGLTPAVKAAIQENQETLRMFVPVPSIASPPVSQPAKDEQLTDEEFYAAIRALPE
jgi:hypothetical protein